MMTVTTTKYEVRGTTTHGNGTIPVSTVSRCQYGPVEVDTGTGPGLEKAGLRTFESIDTILDGLTRN